MRLNLSVASVGAETVAGEAGAGNGIHHCGSNTVELVGNSCGHVQQALKTQHAHEAHEEPVAPLPASPCSSSSKSSSSSINSSEFHCSSSDSDSSDSDVELSRNPAVQAETSSFKLLCSQAGHWTLHTIPEATDEDKNDTGGGLAGSDTDDALLEVVEVSFLRNEDNRSLAAASTASTDLTEPSSNASTSAASTASTSAASTASTCAASTASTDSTEASVYDSTEESVYADAAASCSTSTAVTEEDSTGAAIHADAFPSTAASSAISADVTEDGDSIEAIDADAVSNAAALSASAADVTEAADLMEDAVCVAAAASSELPANITEDRDSAVEDDFSVASRWEESSADEIMTGRETCDAEETPGDGKATEATHLAEVPLNVETDTTLRLQNISAFYHQCVTSSISAHGLKKQGRAQMARKLFHECLTSKASTDAVGPHEPHRSSTLEETVPSNPIREPQLEPDCQAEPLVKELTNIFDFNSKDEAVQGDSSDSDHCDSQRHITQVNRPLIMLDTSQDTPCGNSCDVWPFPLWQPSPCKSCHRGNCDHPLETSDQLVDVEPQSYRQAQALDQTDDGCSDIDATSETYV